MLGGAKELKGNLLASRPNGEMAAPELVGSGAVRRHFRRETPVTIAPGNIFMTVLRASLDDSA